MVCDASAYQISSKSNYPTLRYDVTAIFKMAAVRHVGFGVKMINHQGTVFVGFDLRLKLRLDRIYSLELLRF